MRRILLPSLLFAAIVIAGPAFAQNAASSNYNVSWAALNPGNDWAAEVIQSLFPMYGAGSAPSTGNEATVIGQIVDQFTGFVAAIACAFVCYNILMNIHRAAESSRILGSGQSWMFVAARWLRRDHDVSARQWLLRRPGPRLSERDVGRRHGQGALQNAIKAVGPDAMFIAQPMIPGTEQIVLGSDPERTLHGPGQPRRQHQQHGAHHPAPSTGTYPSGGGYVSWNYALSAGNQSGSPACGTVTIQTPPPIRRPSPAQPVDMAAIQQAALNDVLKGASAIQRAAGRAKSLAEQNRRLADAAPGHAHQCAAGLHRAN